MAKLVYSISTSLDGYVEDTTGAFDWVDPEGAFEFITELVRPMGTYLIGRRLYETMSYWDAPASADFPPDQREFARVWQTAEKIVFSRTLTGVPMGYARIERNFDAKAIAKLKSESERDILIGGAELAGLALEAGLLDECHLFVDPVIVGGGKPAFRTAMRRSFELIDTRRFDGGVVHAHYRIRGDR